MTTTETKSTKSKRNWADLGPRLLSASILISITVVVVYFGGYWFAALVGGVFAGAYREWEMMINGQRPTPLTWVLIALIGLVALAFPIYGWVGSAVICAIAVVFGLLIPGASKGWRSIGTVYFSLAVLAFMLIRGETQLGILAAALLAFTIWLTDSAAFFAGRQIGGVKLSPDISPSKTWSGALGGLAFGVLAAGVIWIAFAPSPWWIGLLFGAVISVAGQIGDLVESAVKRHFRIKDSSDIIPGHGGLMDRLDSLALSGIVLAAIGLVHGGVDLIAQGILIW